MFVGTTVTTKTSFCSVSTWDFLALILSSTENSFEIPALCCVRFFYTALLTRNVFTTANKRRLMARSLIQIAALKRRWSYRLPRLRKARPYYSEARGHGTSPSLYIPIWSGELSKPERKGWLFVERNKPTCLLLPVATSNDHHQSYYLTASYPRRVTRREIPLSGTKLDSGVGGDATNNEVYWIV